MIAFLAATLLAAPGDALVFAPKEGAVVRKTFTLRHDLVAQTMKIERPEGVQTFQSGYDVASVVTLEVTDACRAVEAGRPLELQRLYRVAGLDVRQEYTDTNGQARVERWLGETPLEDASVVFAWVPEEKGYGRHYDRAEKLEEYLAGLREDLDLRGLLPAKPDAAVLSTWTIEPEAFVDVFGAGGDVPRVFVQGGQGFLAKPIGSGLAGPLAPVFGGTLAGKASATWKETREEGGARLAVVELRVELEAKRDQTAWMRTALRTDELLDEVSVAKATIEWKFDGEGTLLWNLGEGRFESLTLRGREEVASDIAFGSAEAPTSRQGMSFAGALQIAAVASAE